MSKSYESRGYLKDVETGERLFTTVMYDNGKRIEGTREVIMILHRRIPEIATQLGGKGLRTRDFINAFQIRGPDYGDVVRKAIDRLAAEKKMLKKNIGTADKPIYRYDLIP